MKSPLATLFEHYRLSNDGQGDYGRFIALSRILLDLQALAQHHKINFDDVIERADFLASLKGCCLSKQRTNSQAWKHYEWMLAGEAKLTITTKGRMSGPEQSTFDKLVGAKGIQLADTCREYSGFDVTHFREIADYVRNQWSATATVV